MLIKIPAPLIYHLTASLTAEKTHCKFFFFVNCVSSLGCKMAKFLFMMFILSTLICESVCAVSETASNLWQSAHSAVKSLGDDAHSYLVSLFGQQTVNTLLKTTGDGINEISQAVSHALNAVEVYITELLRAAGIDAKLQKIFTPEGVVLVGQWALLTVPQYWLLLAGVIALFPLKFIFVVGTVLKCGYWLLSLAVCLFAGVMRLTFLPLKFIFTIVEIFRKFRNLARPLSEIRSKIKKKMRATK